MVDTKDSGRYKVANCTQAQPVFYGFAGLPDGKVILVSVLTLTRVTIAGREYEVHPVAALGFRMFPLTNTRNCETTSGPTACVSGLWSAAGGSSTAALV